MISRPSRGRWCARRGRPVGCGGDGKGAPAGLPRGLLTAMLPEGDKCARWTSAPPDLMDLQAILSAILKWTWKQAFAVLAGGITTLLVAHLGLVSGTTELTIALIASFAGWYLVALVVDTTAHGALTGFRAYRARRTQRAHALQNLGQLQLDEAGWLAWAYHRRNGRFRANWEEVYPLTQLGIFVAEDVNAGGNEKIFLINPTPKRSRTPSR
jgi:hypothetical protein